jgi:hypothetical protein
MYILGSVQDDHEGHLYRILSQDLLFAFRYLQKTKA